MGADLVGVTSAVPDYRRVSLVAHVADQPTFIDHKRPSVFHLAPAGTLLIWEPVGGVSGAHAARHSSHSNSAMHGRQIHPSAAPHHVTSSLFPQLLQRPSG